MGYFLSSSDSFIYCYVYTCSSWAPSPYSNFLLCLPTTVLSPPPPPLSNFYSSFFLIAKMSCPSLQVSQIPTQLSITREGLFKHPCVGDHDAKLVWLEMRRHRDLEVCWLSVWWAEENGKEGVQSLGFGLDFSKYLMCCCYLQSFQIWLPSLISNFKWGSHVFFSWCLLFFYFAYSFICLLILLSNCILGIPVCVWIF